MFFFKSFYLNFLSRKKLQKRPAQVSKLAYLATLVVKNSSKLGFNSLAQAFASRSRLLLVSYCVTSLIRLLLVACVCRSNLGNKRTRFTHYQHRMAHTLRHFCSNSSIGTYTRCCSTPCRFYLKLPLYARFISFLCSRTVGARSARPMSRFCHSIFAERNEDSEISLSSYVNRSSKG